MPEHDFDTALTERTQGVPDVTLEEALNVGIKRLRAACDILEQAVKDRDLPMVMHAATDIRLGGDSIREACAPQDFLAMLMITVNVDETHARYLDALRAAGVDLRMYGHE